jgi:hypothetical protein
MSSHPPFAIPHLRDRTSSVSSASSSSDIDSDQTKVQPYKDEEGSQDSLKKYHEYPPKYKDRHSNTNSKLQDDDSFQDEDEAALLDEEEQVGLMMKASIGR